MKNERKTLKTPFDVPLTTLKKQKKNQKKLFKLFERNNYI